MRNKENRRKQRWRDINMHEREIRGEMEENERKWEINDKKASEKQFTTFVSSALVLSLDSYTL